MPHPKRAAVAGHICLDIIPDLTNVPSGKFFEYFQPGLMVQIGSPLISTGGPVSNTGIALHILGIQSYLMGKVGNDLYGEIICDLLHDIHPSLVNGMIVDENSSTSYTIIISPPGIDRLFLHHPGANNTYGIDDIDFERLKEVDLFHFGYPPVMRRMFQNEGDELVSIFIKAKEINLTTSLDLCFPDPETEGGKANWPKILRKTLPFVDIFTPSIEELLFTLKNDLYWDLFNRVGSRFGNIITPEILEPILYEILDMGAKAILLKLGERGSLLRTGSHDNIKLFGKAAPHDTISWSNKLYWAPCFKVEVGGTTGSGDATIAGFLSGLLRDCSPHDALTSAVAVGACNVEAVDAISGIRTWEETQERIRHGWAQDELDFKFTGWEWDEEKNLWVGPI